jgi:hypothetical protein
MPGEGVIPLCLVKSLLRNQHIHNGAGTHFEAGLRGIDRALRRNDRLPECANFLDATQHAPIGISGLAHGSSLDIIEVL